MSKRNIIPEPGDLDDEGYFIGENGDRIGICDDCGAEASRSNGCCSNSIAPIT